MITIKRSDITLSEESEYTFAQTQPMYWTATFDGRLSTGERAVLFRSGRSWGKALKALEDAFVNEGWVVEDDDS